MKKKFIFIFFFVFFNIFLVGPLFLRGSSTTPSQSELITFTFTDNSPVLDLTWNDNEQVSLENFKSSSKDTNAFVKLRGQEIEELDLTAKEDTYLYLHKTKIPLKKNFRAIFDEGQLKIIAPKGSSQIGDFPEPVSGGLSRITYTVPEGGNLVLDSGENLFAKDYVLQKGELKYSLKRGHFYIPPGKEVILNNFYINSRRGKVDLGKEITFDWVGEGITAKGHGFDISFNSGTPTTFNSGNPLISLSNAKNKKYFRLGDSGEDVKQIQKIVGLKIQNGKYDDLTFEAVRKWQEENGLKVDGAFGKNSLKKVYGKNSFDSGNPLISLSNAKNKKYFRLGDSGEDVKQIQEFLISENYLPETYVGKSGKIINSNDGDFGSLTKKALMKWQEENGLKVDGAFGKNSLEKAKSFNNNVLVSMNGGSARITNDDNGLDISLEGKTAIKIGNEKYSFDGESINQDILTSLKYSEVFVPTKLTFKGSKETVIDLVPVKKINKKVLIDAATAIGIDSHHAYCAAYITGVCPVVLGNEESPVTALDQGMFGSAWKMKSNVLNKGGKNLYSKEDYLTESQKKELSQLKEKIIKKYLQESKKYSSLSKSSRDKKMAALNKKLSDEIRDEESKILNNNNEFSSQLKPQRGDLVSFYYSGSNYLSEAMINGNGGQKNTHVGQIIGSESQNIQISKGQPITNQLAKIFGVEKNKLYLDSYFYMENGKKKPLILKNGKFYKNDASILTSDDLGEIIVSRPQVTHMIHYPNTKTPYQIEFLDAAISRKDLSLYGLARPTSSEYINDVFNFPDFASASGNVLDCSSGSCNALNFEQVLIAQGIDEANSFSKVIISSSKQRQKEMGIPEAQLSSFVGLSSAIIKRESNFGNSFWYSLEKNVDLNSAYTRGYMQINKDYVERSAQSFGEKIPTKSEMYNDKETSLKYGQRYLAEITKIYAPENTPITPSQASLIASAYNAGMYAPRLAAVQKQLQEMGYYSETMNIDGLKGDETYKSLIKFGLKNGLAEEDIKSSLAFLNKEDFENSQIYKLIKKKYYEKTGKKPEYALVPDISSTDIRGTRNTRGYASFVAKNYKNFCPTSC